jgi:hypothetical protein
MRVVNKLADVSMDRTTSRITSPSTTKIRSFLGGITNISNLAEPSACSFALHVHPAAFCAILGLHNLSKSFNKACM